MKNNLQTLYLLNFALLCTHEIDSAYWQEWKLFGIPGGIQVFLVLNLVLVLVGLYGFQQLLRGAKSGLWFSCGVAAAGVAAFGIHSAFLLAGHPEFKLPASLAVIVLTLAASLVQGYLTLKQMRR